MKISYYHQRDKKEIDDFVLKNNGHLLQSFSWGDFQAKEGRQIFRLGVEDKGKILLYAQVILHQLPLKKSYLYVPRGPVFNQANYNAANANLLAILLNEIKALAKNNRAIFLKIEPEAAWNSEQVKIFTQAGFVFSRKKIQPSDTLMIDIGTNEEDILQKMHHKTRYNIRLSSRKGVEAITGDSEEDVNAFYDLMAMTAARDNFKPHSRKYYRRLIDILGRENLVKLYLAKKDKKIIAGILAAFWGKRATYLHGAMDGKYRKFMAPHLLQWQAMLDARKKGCIKYDMWGIAPKEHEDDHPWAGITRFKEGFGGDKIYLAGALDLVYQKFWYRLYTLAANKKA